MLAGGHKRASVASQTRLLLAPACGNDSPSLNKGKRPSTLPGCAAPELLLLPHTSFVSPFEGCHFRHVSPRM